MKLFAIALLAALTTTGCRTVSPAQQLVENARIGRVEWDDVDLADGIIFLVEKVNAGWQPTKGSIGLIHEPDQVDDAEESKFERLREFCAGKKITLHVDNCPPLDILSFLTKCAGVEYEFRSGRIVVIFPDGEVLGGEDTVANKAAEPSVSPAPQVQR